MRRVPYIVLACALLVISTSNAAVRFVAPQTDGWHVWQVDASNGGSNACCYRFRDGDISMQGCDLDGHGGFSTSHGDCDLDGDYVNVYVRISDGKVSRVRALNADCPVTAKSAINDLGIVESKASVDWLIAQIDETPRLAEDAMAAISAHDGKLALAALRDVLENRQRRQKTREQALFWLAQIDSDDVFAYIDALLSDNNAK